MRSFSLANWQGLKDDVWFESGSQMDVLVHYWWEYKLMQTFSAIAQHMFKL